MYYHGQISWGLVVVVVEAEAVVVVVFQSASLHSQGRPGPCCNLLVISSKCV